MAVSFSLLLLSNQPPNGSLNRYLHVLGKPLVVSLVVDGEPPIAVGS